MQDAISLGSGQGVGNAFGIFLEGLRPMLRHQIFAKGIKVLGFSLELCVDLRTLTFDAINVVAQPVDTVIALSVSCNVV